MSSKRFTLISPLVRQNACAAIKEAQDGWRVTISPPNRSLDQNAFFHAICHDLSKSGMKWYGKTRTLDEWKMLLVSGHAIATKEGAEVVAGIEGEIVPIRESTARMSVGRASSLIEYALAFCSHNGVEMKEVEKGGWE